MTDPNRAYRDADCLHRDGMPSLDLLTCARANAERMDPNSNLRALIVDLADRLDSAYERELWR